MDLYDLKHFRFFYKYHEKVNPKYIIHFFFRTRIKQLISFPNEYKQDLMAR